MNIACIDGKWVNSEEPQLLLSNRGYRYGDGIFETLKFTDGNAPLISYHFDRLFHSLAALRFAVPVLFTRGLLEKQLGELCRKNKLQDARIRLSVFRGNGGLYDSDHKLHYVMECWPLPANVNEFNVNGWVLGIYPDGRKSTDAFSNIKSSSGLIYSMAAMYGREQRWNETVLLNTNGTIADGTITNLFYTRKNIIYTPSPCSGCVNGVMRRYLLEVFEQNGVNCVEKEIHPDELDDADEIFMTNAIQGIRWVGQFKNREYANLLSASFYHRFCKTIRK